MPWHIKLQAPLILLATLLLTHSAFGQVDLSGEWLSLIHIYFLAARDRRKNLRIKVRSGVERHPSRPHEMPRMQDGGRKAILLSLIHI